MPLFLDMVPVLELEVPPSSICTARLEVADAGTESELPPHIHRQRHFPEAEVLAALDRAGLECLDVHGHGLDGVLCQPLDEEVHTKAIYIARRKTMRRPRMKQTIQSVDGPNGDLYLMRPAVGLDLQIENPSEKDRALLAALDGTRTPQELSESFGAEETYKALSQLEGLGVLEDAADDDLIPEEIRSRYDRQLRYFGDISEGPTASECQRRLKEARIAVLGVGGLGGWSALALAGCGVGEMLLVDFDRVELNNLNRQVLYAVGDVGRSKVEVAAERLGALRSRDADRDKGRAPWQRGGRGRCDRGLRHGDRGGRLACL
jgi:ThiF family